MLMPLIIGVMLESFETEFQFANSDKYINSAHIREFKQVWRQLHQEWRDREGWADSEASVSGPSAIHSAVSFGISPKSSLNPAIDAEAGEAVTSASPANRFTLPAAALPELLRRSPPPIGIKGSGSATPRADLMRAIRELPVPINKGMTINFYATLRAIMMRAWQGEDLDANVLALADLELRGQAKKYMNTAAILAPEAGYSADVLYAALYVQHHWRSLRRRQEAHLVGAEAGSAPDVVAVV